MQATTLDLGSKIAGPAQEGPVLPALWDRGKLMARLEERVRWHEGNGKYQRAAIRAVAAETGLHPMRVKRLAIAFPEA